MKEQKRKRTMFFIKVITAHVIIYWTFAFIAMPLTMDYIDDIVELMGFKPLEEINMIGVFVAQVVRGFLLALVIWWITDSIIGKKLGWLKLWAILIILGIFNTYSPAQGSIQGMIYLKPVEGIPASMSFASLELLLQPLLLSIVVCTNWRELKSKIYNKKNKLKAE